MKKKKPTTRDMLHVTPTTLSAAKIAMSGTCRQRTKCPNCSSPSCPVAHQSHAERWFLYAAWSQEKHALVSPFFSSSAPADEGQQRRWLLILAYFQLSLSRLGKSHGWNDPKLSQTEISIYELFLWAFLFYALFTKHGTLQLPGTHIYSFGH